MEVVHIGGTVPSTVDNYLPTTQRSADPGKRSSGGLGGLGRASAVMSVGRSLLGSVASSRLHPSLKRFPCFWTRLVALLEPSSGGSRAHPRVGPGLRRSLVTRSIAHTSTSVKPFSPNLAIRILELLKPGQPRPGHHVATLLADHRPLSPSSAVRHLGLRSMPGGRIPDLS